MVEIKSGINCTHNLCMRKKKNIPFTETPNGNDNNGDKSFSWANAIDSSLWRS